MAVDLVGVCDFPGAAGVSVVVGHGLEWCGVFGLFGVEGVAVLVLGAADLAGPTDGVNLEDGVVGPVDHGVDAQAEEMLMVVCVDSRVNFGAPALGVLTGVHGIGVEDTRQLDVELDGAVLVEDPVDAVLVVCGSEDVRDDEAPTPGDDGRVIAEVSVLEQDARVLLVDTDCVLDY